MYKNFLKLKRRLTLASLTKSVILGLSSGVFVSSLVALIYKCSDKIPILSVCAFSGAVTAILSLLIYLAIFYPSERRTAKILDTSLGLGEKVSTMIEFKNESGDMLEMQRIDTETILGNADTKKLRDKHLFLNLIMPFFASVLLIIAIVVPNPQNSAILPDTDSDPDFTLSAWQEQALKDLIEDVRRSEMESTPKLTTISELEGLLTELKAVKKVSAMKVSVIGAIKDIKKATSDHNSSQKIAVSMSTREPLKSLSLPIDSLDALTFGQELLEIRTLAKGENFADVTSNVSQSIISALADSGADPSDKLYVALQNFAGSLSMIASGEVKGDEIDASFTFHGENIGNALLSQYTNRSVCDGAVRRLMQIFGISESELPAESRPTAPSVKEDEGDYKPEDNDDPLHSGGFGSGDMIYGSDDMIYDPESGKYVPYGEVINKYYAKISEQFADGNVSKELEQLISDYYASLFNGTGNEND